MKISKFIIALLCITFFALAGCQRHSDIEINGGVRLVYQVDLSNIDTKDTAAVIDRDISAINRRIEAFGISNSIIQKENSDRIIVERAFLEK